MIASLAVAGRGRCPIWHMPADANALFSNGATSNDRRISMTIVWIILGVATVGIIAKRAARGHDRHAQSHLGFVSHQWLADHRLSQVSDSQR